MQYAYIQQILYKLCVAINFMTSVVGRSSCVLLAYVILRINKTSQCYSMLYYVCVVMCAIIDIRCGVKYIPMIEASRFAVFINY